MILSKKLISNLQIFSIKIMFFLSFVFHWSEFLFIDYTNNLKLQNLF